MRGSHTLFNDIFIDEKPDIKPSKGRSAELHEKKIECICARYFFYGRQNLTYTYILNVLSDEFWLSKITIVHILSERHAQLHKLKTAPPSNKDFAKRWPHLVW